MLPNNVTTHLKCSDSVSMCLGFITRMRSTDNKRTNLVYVCVCACVYVHLTPVAQDLGLVFSDILY